ncbi:MAG: YbhB/YbcL family Raf kinase inhibitor-like protein [Bdellovibrionales bacterium]
MKYALIFLFLGGAAMASDFTLKSTAFSNQGDIPVRFTCDGANVSPELSWEGAPKETKVFALIVDDPDAPDPEKPEKVVSHWVLYNIPGNVKSFAEGAKTFPRSTQQGLNYEGKTGYAGPCPPIGKHRYFFKIFALDGSVHFMVRPSKQDLEKGMVGHILAQSELVGLYAKKK